MFPASHWQELLYILFCLFQICLSTHSFNLVPRNISLSLSYHHHHHHHHQNQTTTKFGTLFFIAVCKREYPQVTFQPSFPQGARKKNAKQ
jgi:hypothetical protein